MIIETPVRGYFEENCFFALDEATKHGFVIDPGAEPERLLNMIGGKGWVIEKILLTHGHFDHFGAANFLRKELGAPVYAHRSAVRYLMNAQLNLSAFCGPALVLDSTLALEDGDEIALESNSAFSLKVLHTPGHTPDSVTFYSAHEAAAFVGDTIFKGSAGITRFPGGNAKALRQSILDKIFTLPEQTVLYSGHSEPTTVKEEKTRLGIR